MLSEDAMLSNMRFFLYVSALTQPFLQRQPFSALSIPPPDFHRQGMGRDTELCEAHTLMFTNSMP